MARTQTSCPACKQSVVVEIQQVFDMAQDKLAKQKLLSNASNLMQCPSCGYQGMVAIPIIYHDPEKEMLLTFFPPDLHTPVNEQEMQVGPLINKIMNDLPQEKRKAYLLQPQSMLTYQTLIEKILEADGITKEMLNAQQERIQLLEKLITAQKDERLTIFEKEKEIIDINFFSILSRIIESASAQGDEKSQQPLIELQEQLFEHTEVGKQLFSQAQETESAIKALQDASKDGLTREKLLDLLIKADTDIKISTIASFARAGLDYGFFQLLSGQIESEKEKTKKQELTSLRENLLKITEEIDKRLQEEMGKSKQLLEKILASKEIEEEMQNNINSVNDFFIQLLQAELSEARKAGDLERIQKLERAMIVIEKASAPPKEVQLLEKFLDFADASDLKRLIEENSEAINQDFLSLLNNVVNQVQQQKDQQELQEKVNVIYKAVLKHSMKKQMGADQAL